MKLLLDEMWSPSLALALRLRGYDVLSVLERADLEAKPDEFILNAARIEGRLVVTENVPDFRKIQSRVASAGVKCPGLVFTTNRRHPRHGSRSVGRMVKSLEAVLHQFQTDEPPANCEIWL